ncbi:TRAPP complex core subunit [Maudiozyma humilis]|uniref:Trafficking protein particle complex subunit BET3 n=1 Tax=Maudiozyma humilis TaxID=51915 RepID=A0AAV5RWF2_MAUHU|nr:TRAPP complex core subunit [Kazachstania humilis]
MSRPVSTISGQSGLSSSGSGAPLGGQGRSLKATGDDIWKNKTEKINAELFTLTYGAIVSQLCEDYDRDFAKINDQLFQMGYNIGVRLIEDFLARTALPRCEDMVRTSEVISKCAFKVFLNISPKVTNWSANKEAFSLVINDNPLSDFVELPMDAMKGLWYSNVLCGVLKGALEMVQLDCDVAFVSDILRGDQLTEIKIKLNRVLKDEIPIGED